MIAIMTRVRKCLNISYTNGTRTRGRALPGPRIGDRAMSLPVRPVSGIAMGGSPLGARRPGDKMPWPAT
eukprot:SAG22_NODE_1866_length_3405_cov_5.505594_5_plen_69_part_00